MNQYALFLGCQIPTRVKGYELSTRAVLHELGINPVDIPAFTCCGYPMRNFHRLAFLTSAARNLALAERQGLDIMTLCMCCFGTLKKAEQFMAEDPELKDQVNVFLAEEGLHYAGKTRIRHLFNILYQEVELTKIKAAVTTPFTDLKIAAHYGCHALRPSDITLFDDAVAPSIFEEMLETTGATALAWDNKYDCCGAPLLGIDNEMAYGLTRKKLDLAHKKGAQYLCTGCPYCQLQFENVPPVQGIPRIPSILFTQILGLAMGIAPDTLGLEKGYPEPGKKSVKSQA
ncbi:MAG: CoB--CoM heterodisulfide reductase iron-sulfur subunit B family protein [Desulfoplanes sp.]|nr:CoB--CoM heterodisulfide reductase iron-sulfur subunit B family protein [Desulfoplanes sp.]